MVSVGFFKKKFLRDSELYYLGSSKFYLFSGFLEAEGQNTGYFLPAFSSCLEDRGDVGGTAAPAWASGNAFLTSQCHEYDSVPRERKQILRDSQAKFTSDTYLNLIQVSGILASTF